MQPSPSSSSSAHTTTTNPPPVPASTPQRIHPGLRTKETRDALSTLVKSKETLAALARSIYPDAANPTHSMAHELFPDTFGPPADYVPRSSSGSGPAAALDLPPMDPAIRDEFLDVEGLDERTPMSAIAKSKRRAVPPSTPSSLGKERRDGETTEEGRERRRRKRKNNLAYKRAGIQAQADRLARLLALGEVPKVRPYGKEGFMSMSVTHEMFAIDEAYAPLSSPNPRPVSSNPVWSAFAASYLLPTVSAFLTCPTPWSDYAATLHACERTTYWSKFCEGGGPGNEKERARRKGGGGGVGGGGVIGDGVGKEERWMGGGVEDGELPGLGREWGLGCAEMATVQARRMVEWPFDPRKTSDGTWFLSACSFLSVLLCWSRKAPSAVIGPYLARQLTHRIKSLLAVSTSYTSTPSPALATAHSSPANTNSVTKAATNGKAREGTHNGVLSHPYDKPMLERLISFLPLPEPLGRDAVGFGREASCCARESCGRQLGDGLVPSTNSTTVSSHVPTIAAPEMQANGSSSSLQRLSQNGAVGEAESEGEAEGKGELKQCSRCRSVVYCSKLHQREDWRKRHSDHCWPTAITGTAPHFDAFASLASPPPAPAPISATKAASSSPMRKGSSLGTPTPSSTAAFARNGHEEEDDEDEDEDDEGTEAGSTSFAATESLISSPTSSFSNDVALPALQQGQSNGGPATTNGGGGGGMGPVEANGAGGGGGSGGKKKKKKKR